MTADEALKELNRMILCLTDGGNLTKEVIALEYAVDAIRKCEKIEQICKENYDWFTTRAIEEVKAVLGDRNDDCN